MNSVHGPIGDQNDFAQLVNGWETETQTKQMRGRAIKTYNYSGIINSKIKACTAVSTFDSIQK
jgi:hypothetical protein